MAIVRDWSRFFRDELKALARRNALEAWSRSFSVPSRNCSHPQLGGFSRRARIVKAEPVAHLECFVKNPLGPFLYGKRWFPPPPRRHSIQKEPFWKMLYEISPDSERGDQKSVPPRYAVSGTPLLRKSEKAIIRTLFRICGKRWIEPKT